MVSNLNLLRFPMLLALEFTQRYRRSHNRIEEVLKVFSASRRAPANKVTDHRCGKKSCVLTPNAAARNG